jgi:hypothetical protein
MRTHCQDTTNNGGSHPTDRFHVNIRIVQLSRGRCDVHCVDDAIGCVQKVGLAHKQLSSRSTTKDLTSPPNTTLARSHKSEGGGGALTGMPMLQLEMFNSPLGPLPKYCAWSGARVALYSSDAGTRKRSSSIPFTLTVSPKFVMSSSLHG